MTKPDFVKLLAGNMGITRAAAERILNAVLDSIEDALVRDRRLQLKNLGVFTVAKSGERRCQNFATGEMMTVSGREILHFRAARSLNELLNSEKVAAETAKKSN